ncbi:hypothetical protein FGO68_gene8836 [Halteria grandinella]|uniref:Uncharacterized protein n=1 Tax=Halteria grandinella TaxID=5974 RepID=A0A8J8SZL6_HALGN|nr:hypothetical protein FGO68_gene8836 [Halteria grandinella]
MLKFDIQIQMDSIFRLQKLELTLSSQEDRHSTLTTNCRLSSHQSSIKDSPYALTTLSVDKGDAEIQKTVYMFEEQSKPVNLSTIQYPVRPQLPSQLEKQLSSIQSMKQSAHLPIQQSSILQTHSTHPQTLPTMNTTDFITIGGATLSNPLYRDDLYQEIGSLRTDAIQMKHMIDYQQREIDRLTRALGDKECEIGEYQKQQEMLLGVIEEMNERVAGHVEQMGQVDGERAMVSQFVSQLLRRHFMDYENHTIDTPIEQKLDLLESHIILMKDKAVERQVKKLTKAKRANEKENHRPVLQLKQRVKSVEGLKHFR